MDIIILVLLIITLIVSTISLIRCWQNKENHGTVQTEDLRNEIRRDMQEQISALRSELSRTNTDNITLLAKHLRENTSESFRLQNETLRTALDAVQKQLEQFEKRLSSFAADNSRNLENIRTSVSASLTQMRDDNNKKLDEMRKTVDEKLQSELQKRMRESFAEVSALMERLQKDIGSMRSLADDVGGLKKSLTNVKTRGMMGEFQLESILREVFSASQFEKNAHPNPDKPTAVVEFAVKIPTEDDNFIYLPIDSKFPQDKYQAVIYAAESGSREQADAAMKQYLSELKRCADEIGKYISPPYTTDYAIMFLPTESMYADAVNHGMLEELWKRSKVYIAGPSTVAALLGSMQLSFNNLAIRKRANEVFGVLTEVRTEFDRFAEALQKMQKHLKQTDDDLSALIGTRTKQMQRKLNRISQVALGEGEDETAVPLLSDDDA